MIKQRLLLLKKIQENTKFHATAWKQWAEVRAKGGRETKGRVRYKNTCVTRYDKIVTRVHTVHRQENIYNTCKQTAEK